MKLITMHIPERDLEMLNDLVKMKKYPSRSEAIRMAIKDLLHSEHPIYISEKTKGGSHNHNQPNERRAKTNWRMENI